MDKLEYAYEEVLYLKHYNWIAFAPFYLLVVILFLAIAQKGSNAVTAFHQQRPVQREFQIVIDAGHGGIDGGATSCTGVLESHMNLQIAIRLESFLHLLGYKTIMVRRTDESVYTQGNTIAAQKVSDLQERVRLVNETENCILVSLHQNTFSDRRYCGAQVFYAPTEKSSTLAQMLQDNLVNHLNPGSKRKSKSAKGVYLMDHIQAPGVLIECGFISNPAEEALLRNTNYQKKLCTVIGCTLSCYLSGA